MSVSVAHVHRNRFVFVASNFNRGPFDRLQVDFSARSAPSLPSDAAGAEGDVTGAKGYLTLITKIVEREGEREAVDFGGN